MTTDIKSTSPQQPAADNVEAERGIIHLFARHPVAANLLMAILIILGSYSLIKLNRQFFPNFALDYVTVRVVWPGASAEDVEQSITVPLEQALRTVDGAKQMTSTSTRGVSLVVLEFEEGSNMGIALDDVKQFVSNVRHLPSDSEDPVVKKVARYEPVA